MTRNYIAIAAAGLVVITASSRPVCADSGAIQLQHLPNLAIEGEGADNKPPGVDMTLVDSSGFNTNGFGRVMLTKVNGTQTFLLDARNLAPGTTAFNFAYGVLIAAAPGSTNFNHIGVMNLVSSNAKKRRSHWILRYSNVGSAPPQLGVADVAGLAGLELRIVTSPLSPSPNKVALHAILPPVLPDPTVLSALKKIAMTVPPAGPGTPPSPLAIGTLTVQHDGLKGRSVLSIQASNLSKGTGYIVFLENAPGADQYTEIDELNEPANFPNNLAGGSLRLDTIKGNALDFFASTPADLAGRKILVVDPFFDAFNPSLSSVHLMATMPAFP